LRDLIKPAGITLAALTGRIGEAPAYSILTPWLRAEGRRPPCERRAAAATASAEREAELKAG